MFHEPKLKFCQEFPRIWHSVLWEFLLFKFPKETKDAKGNISVHYEASLNVICLDLMSYCNMDGRHKTTGTMKEEAFGSTKVCTTVIGKK